MGITLQRLRDDFYGMHGQLLNDDGSLLCYTIEQHWHDNQHDVSCIPAGKYDCIPHDTQNHPNCWEVSNVPDRAAILIHTGNTIADTQGCIIVGLQANAAGVLQSQMALIKLRGVLPSNFQLTITDPA